jgi:hypothetical protein
MKGFHGSRPPDEGLFALQMSPWTTAYCFRTGSARCYTGRKVRTTL